MAMTQEKIRAIGYDSRSIQDDEIMNETSFSATGPFLLIANRPIPKDSKVYMEFTITTPQPTNKDIRHIPLCLGVHKEPSFGVLGADCSLGACYYTKNAYLLGSTTAEYLAFCVRDKYASQMMRYRYIKETTGRVPIRGTFIGLGVDMPNNLISIFSDGVLFYQFSPSEFHVNEVGDIYLAAYCAESGEQLAGEVNFGRFRCKYTPEGYFDMYQELYDKLEVDYDIESHITVGNRYSYSYDENVLLGLVDVDNDLAPVVNNRRDIELITNHEGLEYYKDDEKTIVNKHAFVFRSNDQTLEDPDYAYIGYPLDHHKRLYFEFFSSGASLIEDQMGIPISIGITKDPTKLDNESFEIDLFHLRTDGYHLRTLKDGFEFIEGNYDIRNPSSPIQPNTIGVIVDLEKNCIELYTEGSIYTVTYPNLDVVDFSKDENLIYFYFKSQPSVFTGEGHVVCNFGTKTQSELGNGEDTDELVGYIDEPLKWQYLADEIYVMDLFYYFNLPLKNNFIYDIPCTAKIISDHIPYSKYIFSTITVKEDADRAKEWGPGLNTLYQTYNKVSDVEPNHNKPNKSIFDIHKLMEEDSKINKR